MVLKDGLNDAKLVREMISEMTGVKMDMEAIIDNKSGIRVEEDDLTGQWRHGLPPAPPDKVMTIQVLHRSCGASPSGTF